ncbi:MAG: SLC13 family permease [Sulfolobales archaeon]|nr:SLC13 family permease [Sulfolobales archaeon]MDW8082646.1 SLC13 family permease [Sulfolobales archaeon]
MGFESTWGSELVGLGVVLYIVVSLILRSRVSYLPTWSIMAFSSFITVVAGLIQFDEIGSVIDMDVILFLIGMFSLVSLAESSGLLSTLSAWYIGRFKSRYQLIYASSFLFGLLSAFAVNDTVALMGPPIAYTISRATGLNPKFMFLLLAYSLTIGSVMTPIGNPQNVLVAIQSGIPAPFILFAKKLALPTVINLLLLSYVLIKIFRVENSSIDIWLVPQEQIRDKRDATLAGVALATAILTLVVNDLLEFLGAPHFTHRGFIPFVVAAGTYLLARNPRRVIASVDWGTIVFFITMFITMEGVWRSGVLNPVLSYLVFSKLGGVEGVVAVTVSSLLLSQVLSNVPFVKLFIKFLKSVGYGPSDTDIWVALAASSTIAGNLTILGAASNIIVLEVLEAKMNTSISFTEFFKVGVVVTVLNTVVYIFFLLIL